MTLLVGAVVERPTTLRIVHMWPLRERPAVVSMSLYRRFVQQDKGRLEMNTVALMGVGFLIIGYMAASVFYPMLSGGAGYTPTPRRRVAEALELVGLGRGEVFYDLGCGTGEVLIEASKVCDNVNGIELEPIRWLIAKMRARDAKVMLGNLFKRDISDADVVFIFQYRGKINRRIARKIRSEVRRGTRVISYGHPIETMELVQRQDEIFIYWT